MEDVTRPCARCGFPHQPKPGATGQYLSYCRQCRNEYQAEWQRAKVQRCPLTGATRKYAEQMVAVRLRRTCDCGKPIPKHHSKFCSRRCRDASRYEPAERYLFTCVAPVCHNLCMSGHKTAKYCSDRCKQNVKNIQRLGAHRVIACRPHWLLSQPLLGPTLKSWPKFGPELSDWPEYGPTRAPDYLAKACESCGRSFMGGTAKRFCSERCFRNPIDDGKPSSRDIEFATCSDTGCGKLFAFDVRITTPLGCCSEHSKRIQRRRRKRASRARKGGQLHEPYTLREIAERDGWRCHLCGGHVPDRPYSASDDDATIDHLIPQSCGGDDIRSNVALAHNRCNWERGNMDLDEFLELSGWGPVEAT